MDYCKKEYTTGEAIVEGALVTVVGGVLLMADAVTENPIGIATEAVASGAKCTVQVEGVYNYARVNGNSSNIAVGDLLSPTTTDGILVKHAGTATHRYAAKALAAVTTDGGRAPVKILDGIPAEA